MTTQRIKLNLIPGGVMPVIYASQYDNQTDALIFELYNGAQPFSVPQGAAVVINGTKPSIDNEVTGFSYSAASITGNTVICNVTTQMTAVPGDVLCELRVRTESQIIGSINFILRVEPSALNDDTVLSETDIPLIEQAIEIAANLADYIQTAVDSAETASTAAETATEAANNASIYNTNVEGIYDNLTDATAAANAAAQAANAAAETLGDITATATTLAPGSSATASYNSTTGVMTFGIPQGATGASGVTTPISGFYSLYVDADGNLFVVYSDTDDPPAFYYDDATGNLYVFTGSVIRESTGELITIEGGVDFHALSASTTIVAQQSGTGDPSPSNVRSISGWASANIGVRGHNTLKPVSPFSQTVNGVTITLNADGSVTANGTATANAVVVIGTAQLCKGKTYILTGATTTYKAFQLTDYPVVNSKGVNNTTSGLTFTADITSYAVRTYFYNGQTFSNETFYPMIRFANDTDSTWSEYVDGTTYTVSFGSAGTVYGGTLDVTTGVLTVTHGYYEFTDGTTYTPQQTSGGIWFIQAPTLSGIVNSSTELVSNQYKTVATSGSTVVDKCIRSVGSHVNVYDNRFTSAAAVETILTANPIQIVYPLTTPQTFALTPTQISLLQGVNNIWSDTGTLTLKYIEEV